jgi:hypothetical protein
MTENYPSAGPRESWSADPGPALVVGIEPASTVEIGTAGADDLSKAGANDLSKAGANDLSKAGAAKEQATAVGQGAAEAGQHVASVATDQAHNVVAEAGNQAKDLLDQARSELAEQAGAQQKRLAAGLRDLGDELEAMTHHSESPGVATDLARQASTRSHDAASWLDAREPGHLLQELQSFARQKPAAFLALAAGAGLLAGRLGRGVKDASGADSASSASAGDVAEASPAVATAAPRSDLDVSVAAADTRPFASSQDDALQAAHTSGDQW